MMTTTQPGDDTKVVVTLHTHDRVQAMAKLVTLRLAFEYKQHRSTTPKWGIYVPTDVQEISSHQMKQLADLGFKVTRSCILLEGKL